MGQIFRPRANSFARMALLGLVLVIVLPFAIGFALVRSPYVTGVDDVPHQSVPFSHQHHVSGLGIDCRYCHTSVERAAFAGIPPTETCMTCHSQIWTDAPMLEPVRESWRTGKPLHWTRVYDLPDFVYFNHGIHVSHGIGCTTCHGPVGRMPLTRQTTTLFMSWCIDCHREPEKYVRPREHVFDPDWTPPQNRLAQGRELVHKYRIRVGKLTDCSVCHR